MGIAQEAHAIFCSRPRRPEVSSLRRELLNARSELLLQTASWGSPDVARQKREDILDLTYCFPQWALEDLIAHQASVQLRQVERALDHMLDASYGICRECRKDLPLSRLRFQPPAMLCADCIEERLAQQSADAL
jgi:DnaK suppressor protein